MALQRESLNEVRRGWQQQNRRSILFSAQCFHSAGLITRPLTRCDRFTGIGVSIAFDGANIWVANQGSDSVTKL